MEIMQEKRFELSGDIAIKERIAKIKGIIREEKKDYPELLSFCMFGSMTKGKAKESSDIDGFIFIDADKTKEYGQVVEMGVHERKASSEPYAILLNVGFDHDCEGDIKNAFKERMLLTDEQVKDVKILPISEKIIDEHVQEMQNRVNLKKTSKDPRVTLSTIFPSKNLYAMFFLETGGGIRRYRQYLLDKLSSMEEGEKIWSLIAENFEFCENFPSKHAKKYPKTLEEARDIYSK